MHRDISVKNLQWSGLSTQQGRCTSSPSVPLLYRIQSEENSDTISVLTILTWDPRRLYRWFTHPANQDQLILIMDNVAHLYKWQPLTRLTTDRGIQMVWLCTYSTSRTGHTIRHAMFQWQGRCDHLCRVSRLAIQVENSCGILLSSL
jgi:hypothetical protein